MEKTEDIRDVIRRMHAEAQKLGVCPLFTGDEATAEEIFSLFFSPQGEEFCMGHDFPGIDIWRELKGFGAADYGILVDAGEVKLTNPERAVLIGDTRAAIVCDRLDKVGRKPSRVFLMQGARAEIRATNWAVCFVKAAPGCGVERMTGNHGLII